MIFEVEKSNSKLMLDVLNNKEVAKIFKKTQKSVLEVGHKQMKQVAEMN